MSERRPCALVKIGGALLSDPDQLDELWKGIRQLRTDRDVVVVHGGGPQATRMARRLGHEPRIVEGRRVTTDLDLDIMHWTVRGALNTQLVAAALHRSVPAVGLSGVDGGTISVEKRPPWEIGGERIDFGWVGDVRQVNTALLRALLGTGFTPIIAPLAVDAAGQTYNVNADTVAHAVATALHVDQFLLVTESGGVRREPGDADSMMASIDAATYAAGTNAGWIEGGMLVKLRVAFDALSAGIRDVYILPPNDLVSRSRGTRIVA